MLVRPLARLDMLDAVVWYEEQRAGLGQELADELSFAIDRAAREPLLYAEIGGSVRRVLVRRFPYGVFFHLEGDQIVVIAVAHVRRGPRAWRR